MSPPRSILIGEPSEFEAKEEPDFVFEIEAISGPEGQELELMQARAMRAFLLWLKQQREASRDGANDGP